MRSMCNPTINSQGPRSKERHITKRLTLRLSPKGLIKKDDTVSSVLPNINMSGK